MANPKLIRSSSYREFLNEIFFERKSRNKTYSLRAFAKSLKISHSYLAGVLKGTNDLTLTRAKSFLMKLSLDPLEEQVFLELIENPRDGSSLTPTQSRLSIPLVPLEKYSIFSNWYNIVILELAGIPSSQLTAQSAARAMGISEELCAQAISQLLQLGFLEKTADGFVRRLDQVSLNYSTQNEVITRYNQQLLDLTKESLENLPVSERTMSSKIFPMNRRQLAFLQERLYSLLQDIMTQTKESSGPSEYDSIFLVSAQIIPLADIRATQSANTT